MSGRLWGLCWRPGHVGFIEPDRTLSRGLRTSASLVREVGAESLADVTGDIAVVDVFSKEFDFVHDASPSASCFRGGVL